MSSCTDGSTASGLGTISPSIDAGVLLNGNGRLGPHLRTFLYGVHPRLGRQVSQAVRLPYGSVGCLFLGGSLRSRGHHPRH